MARRRWVEEEGTRPPRPPHREWPDPRLMLAGDDVLGGWEDFVRFCDRTGSADVGAWRAEVR